MALGAASAATASEGELEYREHTMEAIGGHMQAAVDILRQKVPHASHMTIHADALAALSGIVGTLFPEGSEGGDALPAIWEEPEDFAGRVEAMREAATAFSAAARSTMRRSARPFRPWVSPAKAATTTTAPTDAQASSSIAQTRAAAPNAVSNAAVQAARAGSRSRRLRPVIMASGIGSRRSA